MKREELLARARRELWAGWALSSEEIGAQAAETLLNLGMLVPEGGAQELEKLRKKVAELEQQLAALTAQGRVLREQTVQESVDRLTRMMAPTQALREPEGEFYGFLHHENRTPHDLPEMGGPR